MGQLVRLDVEDGVGTIVLDRPPMNVLNAAMREELRAAATAVAAASDVRAVVVYGGPKLFAAGADVAEMAAMSPTDMLIAGGPLQSAFTAVAKIRQPVIAAVTGYALGGGCELAMCADLRVAGASARLGQPEILLGIIPGAGGTQRLPRLVGPAKAKELCFTGRFVAADEALRIGLVDQVVPDDEVYDVARRLAMRLARGPAYALRAVKDAIDTGLDVDLDTGLRIEQARFAALFATPDRSVGMASFLEDGPGKAIFGKP